MTEAMEQSTDIKGLPGVGAATADKLENSGFGDVMSIAVASPAQLVNASGITETASRKIIKAARNVLDLGFQTGEALLEKRQQIEKIQLGIESFDALLGGGLETSAITECFGEFGSGKTQIGHMLCVQVQKKYPGTKSVYIDTENTFRPERIVQLAKGQDMDPEEVLKNILVARAYNSDHQMLLVEKVDEMMKKENIKLIVVDSLTAHFRAEFVGRGTLADRQQKLNKHMHSLLRVADKNNACIYVTNQVMAKPDTFFGDPTQAIGGHIVAHASTFRLYLRKGKKGSRVAKLVDSPNLPEGECCFYVREEGLEEFG